MRFALLAVVLFAGLVLAGCVLPEGTGEDPVLRIEAPEAVAMNEAVEVRVRFVNDGDRALVANTTQGCIQVQVWLKVGDEAVLLPGDGAGACSGRREPVTVRPGDALGWGPFRFRPDEWRRGDDPLFRPGSYTLVADVVETDPLWSLRNETRIEVTQAVGELEVTVEPERNPFRAGERIQITATLRNGREQPYTYTSRDGCNDLHVEVETPEGWVRLAPRDGQVCTQALTEFTVPAGGTLETVVHWDASADGRGGAPYVPEGPHTLRATLDGQHDLPQGEGSVFVQRDDA